MAALHLRAAEWFAAHGQIVDAVRHTQSAGDWSGAAQLPADHAFGLMLDGQTQTMAALVRAFPRGVQPADPPELAVVRAMVDLVQGRLDEAAAHLSVAESRLETSPQRRRRLRVTLAALKLSLAKAPRARGRRDGTDRLPHLPGDRRVRRGHRAQQRPARGGADDLEPSRRGPRLSMMPSDISRRAPTSPGGSAGRTSRSAASRNSASPPRSTPSRPPGGAAARRSPWPNATAGGGVDPAPALVTLAAAQVWTGEFDDGERWLQRTVQALGSDTGPGITLLLHLATGMLHAGRGRREDALEEFSESERLESRLAGPHALANQVTGWTAATRARLGRSAEAGAALGSLDDERAAAGEIRNARAVICLVNGEPAAALGAVQAVLDGTAPVIGYVTVVETHLLAGLAHRALGDQRAASRATERALGLAEPDRLVLPFAMTGSAELLEALPVHETAHAALRSDLLDVLRGSSLPVDDLPAVPSTDQLSPSELKVLRYLPTNLSRPEIAGELSVSVNTVNTHIRNIYTKLRPATGPRPSSARDSCGCSRPAATASRPITRSWRCGFAFRRATLPGWSRPLPGTRSRSTVTSGRRFSLPFRRWRPSRSVRRPCSPACSTGRPSTASWPSSRRSA